MHLQFSMETCFTHFIHIKLYPSHSYCIICFIEIEDNANLLCAYANMLLELDFHILKIYRTLPMTLKQVITISGMSIRNHMSNFIVCQLQVTC